MLYNNVLDVFVLLVWVHIKNKGVSKKNYCIIHVLFIVHVHETDVIHLGAFNEWHLPKSLLTRNEAK